MQITGIVQCGNGDAGRLYELPTANLIFVSTELAPGIYTGKVKTEHGIFDSVVCYGVEPGKLEAHLFDFTGNLYDQSITVEIIERVASLTSFISVEQMKRKIHADAATARLCLQA